MDFFGIGLGEILLILVLAAILLGPDNISGIAKNIGKIMRNLKNASASFMAAITKEPEVSKNQPPSTQSKETKAVETPPSTDTQLKPPELIKPQNREGHQESNE